MLIEKDFAKIFPFFAAQIILWRRRELEFADSYLSLPKKNYLFKMLGSLSRLLKIVL